ncbi:MAG: hypothetical protein MJ052_02360 [Sphaerochaetaceae bacterium]|nr:hypothetical protein [Sphaerochaetaceae bacterium]
MLKIDIVMNQAVEEDFLALCKEKGVCEFYTRYTNVTGKGFQEPRMGDETWPQYNVSYMIVVPDEQRDTYLEIVEKLRKDFPDDGIFCCISVTRVF